MQTVPIYTNGGGAILQELFNAIAALAGGSTYLSLLNIALIVGLVWFLMLGIVQRRHARMTLKWFIGFFITFNILLLPKVSVQITDNVNPNQWSIVAGVPWGVAVPASMASNIGNALTQTFEALFSLPNNLDYSQTGMVMASSLVRAANNFQISGPTFQRNMANFVHQCVFYDVLLNRYSLQDLLTSNDIWQLVSSNASPASAFIYTAPDDESGQIVTCQAGVQSLEHDWQTEMQNAAALYGAQLYPSSEAVNAKAELLSNLPVAYQYLTGLSLSASQILQQSMIANAIRDGLSSFATQVNAPAALNNVAFTKAQAEKRAVYQTLGEQAAYWLPIMQVIFSALLYGLFLLVLPLMLLPIGGHVIRSYVLALLWVQLWAPLFSILNLCLTLYASYGSHAAVLLATGQSAFSMMSEAPLNQVNQDMGLLAGYLCMSIPFLSYGILSYGIAPALSQMSQYIGGVAQSTAQNAAHEEVTGNYSLGDTSFDNHSTDNVNAYHWDNAATVNTGNITTSMGDGATLTKTASGQMVINSSGALSSLGSNIQLARSIHDTASEQADSAWNSAIANSRSAVFATSAGLREMLNYNHAISDSDNQAEQEALTHSSDANTSLSHVSNLVDRFAHENNLSRDQSEQLLSGYYASRDLTAKLGLPEAITSISGAGAALSGEAGHKLEALAMSHVADHEMLQRAHSFDQQTGFSHTVDLARHAVEEQSFREGSEQNRQLANALDTHFEEANHFQQEAQTHLTQSEEFRQVATYAVEHSASIDTNANNEFVNWLAGQPSLDGTGQMGVTEAETLINHHPELTENYAEQFVHAKTVAWQDKFNDGTLSKARVAANYAANNQTLGPESAVNAESKWMRAQVRVEAHGLSAPHLAQQKALATTLEKARTETRAALHQQTKDMAMNKKHLGDEYTNNNEKVNHALQTVVRE